MTIVNAVEAVSTKKNNGETLVNIVLDETGSMNSCWESTISAFNDYIGSQKTAPGVCRVTMTMFSDTGRYGFVTTGLSVEPVKSAVRNLYSNKPIADVELLSTANYRPNGGTNLYDAIGSSIRAVEAQLAGQDSVPNVLMVIITDGEENCSKEFTVQGIKDLVKAKEADGWTFVYLGANQDAWKVGQAFGLSKGQTKTYDTNNIQHVMADVSTATMSYRSTRGLMGANIGTVEKEFFKDEKDAS